MIVGGIIVTYLRFGFNRMLRKIERFILTIYDVERPYRRDRASAVLEAAGNRYYFVLIQGLTPIGNREACLTHRYDNGVALAVLQQYFYSVDFLDHL